MEAWREYPPRARNGRVGSGKESSGVMEEEDVDGEVGDTVEEFKHCLLVVVVASVGGSDEKAPSPSSVSLLGAIISVVTTGISQMNLICDIFGCMCIITDTHTTSSNHRQHNDIN